jgi:predicted GIY-YIG superfamily endonuclease/proteasome lid subunit RPN8/RPN11
MPFWAYMLHCRGGVLYTGHTDDLERRIGEHRSGLVPGFTQDMHPLEFVWSQEFVTREEAIRAERQIKGWSRRKKLALIRGDWEEISRLAKGKSGPLRLAGKASRSGQASTSSGRTREGAASLVISDAAIKTLQDHATRAAPQEACGILLGQGNRIERAQPARNVHPAPRTHFEIDPQALIDAHRAARAGGPQVLGYYHSHPSGPAEPSDTDRAMAAGDGSVWAIAAAGDVRCWRDDAAGFAELSYVVADG